MAYWRVLIGSRSFGKAAPEHLEQLAAAGCEVGVITTQPASKSQQNAQRRGFDLLYTRAVLVKHPS